MKKGFWNFIFVEGARKGRKVGFTGRAIKLGALLHAVVFNWI
jgi:hypothetical protein